jgi:hypothetical protein
MSSRCATKASKSFRCLCRRTLPRKRTEAAGARFAAAKSGIRKVSGRDQREATFVVARLHVFPRAVARSRCCSDRFSHTSKLFSYVTRTQP